MMNNSVDLTHGLAEVDRLIHEPARLIIMTVLYSVEAADFLFLQRETGLSKGNLSSHLSRLEEVGYVSIEKTYRGKIPLTLCSLTEKGRLSFETYCIKIKHFINQIP